MLGEEGLVNIEDISVGDKVWAWNEETGEVALKPVVETYVNKTSELVRLLVNGEEIITTPSHPFYSPVKGWTDAVRLRAGDILFLVNGEYVVVEQVQHEILEAPITVYNFQIADYHTYYVSSGGVLVHNMCAKANQRGVGGHGWRGDKAWKANVRIVESGGDIRNLFGGLPTEQEAIDLIQEANGVYITTHPIHPPQTSSHTYNHVHYYAVRNNKSTIEIRML